MAGIAFQDVAIRMAHQAGTLKVEEATGRFGPYWAIVDEHGLIEIALSKDEADGKVAKATS